VSFLECNLGLFASCLLHPVFDSLLTNVNNRSELSSSTVVTNIVSWIYFCKVELICLDCCPYVLGFFVCLFCWLFYLVLFFLWWYWCLNSGPYACYAGAHSTLESLLFLCWYFHDRVPGSFAPDWLWTSLFIILSLQVHTHTHIYIYVHICTCINRIIQCVISWGWLIETCNYQ
jgi:hypothetical protein